MAPGITQVAAVLLAAALLALVTISSISPGGQRTELGGAMDFNEFNQRCINSCGNAAIGAQKCFTKASTLYVLYTDACSLNEHSCQLDKIACGGEWRPQYLN
mmetsp:Transcript_55705/g.132299  ORF Transcript_55705/g.132299 Transcript_55705/m.132299 type:complete len:102 (-) Transcript_55705:179-484(-)